MHITSRGLRFVDVGIIYPILGKVVLQISFTHYRNILAHNTALFTRGNSGLPRLNSSRKSSDIPLPTQSPIWVNPMGPITLNFGKKCYNVTTPGDNLQISSTKRVFILTAQAQVTASGIFPWSDWSTINTQCRPVFMSTNIVLSRVHVLPHSRLLPICDAFFIQRGHRRSLPILRKNFFLIEGRRATMATE